MDKSFFEIDKLQYLMKNRHESSVLGDKSSFEYSKTLKHASNTISYCIKHAIWDYRKVLLLFKQTHYISIIGIHKSAMLKIFQHNCSLNRISMQITKLWPLSVVFISIKNQPSVYPSRIYPTSLSVISRTLERFILFQFLIQWTSYEDGNQVADLY